MSLFEFMSISYRPYAMILISPIILVCKIISIFNPYLSLNPHHRCTLFLHIRQRHRMFLLDFPWNPRNDHIHMTHLYFCADKRVNIVGAVSIYIARIVGALIEVFTLHTVSLVSYVTRASLWTISIGTRGEVGVTSVVTTDTFIIINAGLYITAVSCYMCRHDIQQCHTQAALTSQVPASGHSFMSD